LLFVWNLDIGIWDLTNSKSQTPSTKQLLNHKSKIQNAFVILARLPCLPAGRRRAGYLDLENRRDPSPSCNKALPQFGTTPAESVWNLYIGIWNFTL